MKILLIHPEGSLDYNANLLALVEMLSEAGHRITYVAPRRPAINQRFAPPGVDIILINRPQIGGQFIFPRPEESGPAGESPLDKGAHDFVLAVDRGIIEGAAIARREGVPSGLLSYEIFFHEETSPDLKEAEVAASADVSFAVAPDALRARKLCLANRIDPEKLIYIPVAGRGFRAPEPRPRLLHQMFSLPENTKIALYAGSLADWTGASFLLQSTRSWPDEWVLVIHERFGATQSNLELVQAEADARRVRISDATFARPDEMAAFIQSADLGVALYRPTYVNEWVGRNIEYIGLSSGKIATYLQHGVPVACHELGEISDWIRFYGAGQVFPLDEPFIPVPPREEAAEGCRSLFERHLDAGRFGKRLVAAIQAAVP